MRGYARTRDNSNGEIDVEKVIFEFKTEGMEVDCYNCEIIKKLD